MYLNPQPGNYLTEAADVKIEERHFATTVCLARTSEAVKWREVTEAEKTKMLRQGTIFDIDQLSGVYLDKVDTLRATIPARINEKQLSAADALKHQDYYPEWGDANAPMGKEVDAGFYFRHVGKLYEVRQPHTLQEQWEPGAVGTEDIYTLVQSDYEENPDGHAGTADDPIPYESNQVLEAGKYYEQNGIIYLCTRDSVNPMTHTLAELVGHYVEVAEDAPGGEEEPGEETEEETNV